MTDFSYIPWMEAWLEEEGKYPEDMRVEAAIEQHYFGGVYAFKNDVMLDEDDLE
jgi:hypothetical protein